jgi:hypothetical protein
MIPLVSLNAALFLMASGAMQRWLAPQSPLSPSPLYLLWAALLWAGLLALLLTPGYRTRCDDLALTLPVPAPSLWRAHLTAVLVAGWSLLGAALASMALANMLFTRIAPTRGVQFEPGMGILGPSLAVTFLLAAVILQGASRSRHKTPLRRGYLLAVAVMFPAGLVLVLGLSVAPLPVAVLPLAMALLLARRNAASVPPAFAIADALPDEPRRRSPSEAVPATRTRRPGPLAHGWRLFSLVWRDSHKKLAIPYAILALGFPLVLFLGLLLSSFFLLWDTEGTTALRLTTIPMAWYMLIAFLWPGLLNLHFLDSLPVSRRRVFAVLALPSFLVLAVGLGAGQIGTRVLRPTASAVDFRQVDDDGHYWVLAPWNTLAIRWDGSWPRNSAPWGESHRPSRLEPVLPGGRASIYSPFSTPEGCSIEFVALQLSRAIEATYGTVIPPEEIRQRYLDVDAGGAVVGRTERLNLLGDFPRLRLRQPATMFPLMLLLTGGPFFLLTVLVLQTLREGIKDTRRKGTLWAILGAAMAMYLGTFALAIFDVVDLDRLDGFVGILLRQLESIPGATPLVWAMSLALLAAAYELAYRRFLQAEFPRGSTAGCLL